MESINEDISDSKHDAESHLDEMLLGKEELKKSNEAD